MRATILGALVVTAVEAPAVYAFLRLEDSRFWLGALCLAVGEMLETGISGAKVERRLQQLYGIKDRKQERGPEASHRRRLGVVMLAMSGAEILLWIAWVEVEEEFGWVAAGVFLLVLMHLKHQAEISAVRGVVYSTGIVSWRLTVSNIFEAGGAVVALLLLNSGHEVQAAIALAAGLLLEHVILVDLLLREIELRDIRVPRVPPSRRPRSDFALRMAEFGGENFPWFWWFVDWVRPLRIFFNWLAINGMIRRGPLRPEPLSTMAPYTSWASLTDKTWSGRHLPPVDADPEHPPIEQVAALFEREGEMTPCSKSTLLFTCFAQWFVDGFLRTERDDPKTDAKRDTRRNETPHQIDLNTLYGLTPAMTKQLREHKGGRLRSQRINGEEYPEYLCICGRRKRHFDELLLPLGFSDLTFAQRNRVFAMGSDVRTLGFVAFNTLFLREHNRIAKHLQSRCPDSDEERLFETARMILIMVLLKIVVNEYINHINAYHFKFDLMPKRFQRARWQRPNWMSIEFNLLYRWHSLVPPRFKFGGYELTPEQTLMATRELTNTGLGAFMEAMSCQPAGRIGLFNTDPFLVCVAEWPSIEQGRVAGLRPYNQYRTRFGFPPVTSFDQFSSDLRVQRLLQRVYNRVDRVELFVGLFAEEGGPNAVLPPLMTVMVAFDAFSQLLTNPLVAPRIFNDETFSKVGMDIIKDETHTISELVHRNAPGGKYHVSLEREDYVRV